MLRFVLIAVIGVVILGQAVLQADDVKKTKAVDKSAVKKVDKGKQPTQTKKDVQTKQPQKAGSAVATLGSDADYYTTSPAQGRPADGRLPAGTQVKVIEKAGSYVRVIAVIKAYVPADSLKVSEKQPGGKDKAAIDKATLKKKAIVEKDGAAQKKKAIDKATLKKKAAADKDGAAAKKKPAIDKAALKKKAAAEKDGAAEKEKAAINKKKAAAEKEAAAKKETEKKDKQK